MIADRVGNGVLEPLVLDGSGAWAAAPHTVAAVKRQLARLGTIQAQFQHAEAPHGSLSGQHPELRRTVPGRPLFFDSNLLERINESPMN